MRDEGRTNTATLSSLIGSTLREAGALVLVFGLLDVYLAPDRPPPSAWWPYDIVLVALSTLCFGYILALVEPANVEE